MVETTSCLRTPVLARQFSGGGVAGTGKAVSVAGAVAVNGSVVWVGIISFFGWQAESPKRSERMAKKRVP